MDVDDLAAAALTEIESSSVRGVLGYKRIDELAAARYSRNAKSGHLLVPVHSWSGSSSPCGLDLSRLPMAPAATGLRMLRRCPSLWNPALRQRKLGLHCVMTGSPLVSLPTSQQGT